METYKMLIKLQEGWRAGLISNEPKLYSDIQHHCRGLAQQSVLITPVLETGDPQELWNPAELTSETDLVSRNKMERN